MSSSSYRGRFAPSPSGPLHFGSLIAAVGSYLQARSQQGRWLVRIEDLDPRAKSPAPPMASCAPSRPTACGGMKPWLSKPASCRYQSVLDEFHRRGLTYHCACSRARIQGLGGFSMATVAPWAGRRRQQRAPAHERPCVWL
jgi:glutamyl-Q tRNA(Asp) synthetase